MKLSDYVIQFLEERGVRHVFFLPGGAAMHLNESLGRSTQIEWICNLHEQASAIAAEAYAKTSNKLGVAMVTAGPAGTNAITGVAGAWLDSSPCLFLSGQVKSPDLKRKTGVRMLGVQEVDIVTLVDSITKYAVTVEKPEEIRFHLEKAFYLAHEGRQGPVWIDLPLDIQAATIDPQSLQGFTPPVKDTKAISAELASQVAKTLEFLRAAERPVIVAGNGIRLAGAIPEFRKVVEKLGAPVLTTWLGMDLIEEEHPLNAGRPGAIAPRGANFALQNADAMLVIGSRLDMAFTGYAHDRMARAAKKIMVDIDLAEIQKMKTEIHLPVVADALPFLQELDRQLAKQKAALPSYADWARRCLDWKGRYPLVTDEHRNLKEGVSVYHFSEVLSQELAEGDVIASGSSGTAVELFLLVFGVKAGQRIFHTRGLGAMGFGLPAAIGACVASGRRRTVCVDGDGGFQMNIQELETVARLKLPIIFFVINNDGYSSIRSSQRNYFSHLVAADKTSGLTLPDLKKVAHAYNLAFKRIGSSTNLSEEIRSALATSGPLVVEIMAPAEEQRVPRLSTMQRPDGTMVSKPLEDLFPFLDRAEFRKNMIIPPLED